MNIEIETSKGTFVVNNYRKGLHIESINEQIASLIVDERELSLWQGIQEFLKYYDYTSRDRFGISCLESATESLHSLLKANNIEITNKLYIFKK